MSNELKFYKEAESRGVFGSIGGRSKGKLTTKGYQILFEKQKSLREIDLCQVEKVSLSEKILRFELQY